MSEVQRVMCNIHLRRAPCEDESLGLNGHWPEQDSLPQIADSCSCECVGQVERSHIESNHFSLRRVTRQLLHVRQFLLLQHFLNQYSTQEEMVIAYTKPAEQGTLIGLCNNHDVRPYLMPRIKLPHLNSTCAFFGHNMEERVKIWHDTPYQKAEGLENLPVRVGKITQAIDIPLAVAQFVTQVCRDATLIWPNPADRPMELLMEVQSCMPGFEDLMKVCSGKLQGLGGPAASTTLQLPLNLDAANQLRKRQDATRTRFIRNNGDVWGRDFIHGQLQYVTADSNEVPLSPEIRDRLQADGVDYMDLLDQIEEDEEDNGDYFEAIREIDEALILARNEAYLSHRNATPGMFPSTLAFNPPHYYW